MKLNFRDIEQLTLDSFIDLNRSEGSNEEGDTSTVYDERMSFLGKACNNEFSIREVIVLYNLMIKLLPYEKIRRMPLNVIFSPVRALLRFVALLPTDD